jgi:succinate-semialdehyde dehydrogenase/glutarate-semialdehyde dehydrogenase
MKAINPANGELIREYPEHTRQQVEERLRKAESAFGAWRGVPLHERKALMLRAGKVLRGRKGEFAELMTREMGKPIAAAEAEAEKCATACDYFAEHAAESLAERVVGSDADRSYVRYDPLGAVLAIMPWNFPFWQVFRFAAPALMAGNVGVLKHASNVPGTALAIEEVFREAGFADGCFTTLLVGSAEIEGLIAHPVVRAVTLTGSEKAGMAVGAAAGKVLKKSVLELGGSDPFIVLEDADVAATATAAANARCINNGQSCIAAKRFLVAEPIGDAFATAFVQAMRKLRIGDPMDRATEVGPLAREDLVEALDDQVKRAVQGGARLLCGGKRVAGRKGFYYEPTVLADVRPGNAAFDEETFGPVAAVTRYGDVAEAVELANRSVYGLGASVWTRDTRRGEELAGRIEAGMVFINGAVKSDPRLPFGGVKHSGYGRELADVGIREFVNVKTVWCKEAVQRARSGDRSE